MQKDNYSYTDGIKIRIQLMAKAKPLFVDGVMYRSVRALADAYGLNYRTVANRIARSGQTPEEAVGLNIPHTIHKKQITIHGITYPSINAAARAYNQEPGLVHGRLQQGKSPEVAVQAEKIEPQRGQPITVGTTEFPQIKAAAEFYDLDYRIVQYRLRKKWTVNQVFGIDPPPVNDSINAPKPIKFRGVAYSSQKALAEAFNFDNDKLGRDPVSGQ